MNQLVEHDVRHNFSVIDLHGLKLCKIERDLRGIMEKNHYLTRLNLSDCSLKKLDNLPNVSLS